MNQFPEVSVIMPVYNEGIHDLRESINSILNQTYRNFEYIIVDDNPKSIKIKKYLINRSINNKKIRLVFNDHNIGAMKSSNKGACLARGKFIDRMDADDVAKSNKLYSQLLFLKNNKLDLVCSNFSIMNRNDKITRLYGYNGNTTINQNKIKFILSHCNIAMGPTLFFRSNVFKSINGYRNTNVEDYDLITRFVIHGYNVGYQNDPLLYKKLRKNSISYKTLLNQYVIMKTISKFIRGTRFKMIIPLSLLRNNVNEITNRQKYKFYKFTNYRYSFNNKRNFKEFICMIWSIISSITIIQWCIWSLFNKLYQ